MYKIKEMLTMQKELDTKILEAKGLEYNRTKVAYALIAEIGEMLNEKPSLFKYWKETKEDNYGRFLEELIDVWHFVLSLTTSTTNDYETVSHYALIAKPTEVSYDLKVTIKELVVWACEPQKDPAKGLILFLIMLDQLAVPFDHVEDVYLKKNQINHERLGSGY